MNKTRLHQLIAENRLLEAVRELLILTKNTHLHQDVLLFAARLSEYMNLQIKGIEPSDKLELWRNKFVRGLLTVVEQLPDGD